MSAKQYVVEMGDDRLERVLAGDELVHGRNPAVYPPVYCLRSVSFWRW